MTIFCKGGLFVIANAKRYAPKVTAASRLRFGVVAIALVAAAVSCSGNANNSSIPLNRSDHIESGVRESCSAGGPKVKPCPSPTATPNRGRFAIRIPTGIPSPWDGTTDDVCPQNAYYQCGSAGEGFGEGWSYPDASPSCAPVTWQISGLPSGVTSQFTPASGMIYTPPYTVGLTMTADPNKPPTVGLYSYTMQGSSPTCGLGGGTGYFYILCTYALNNCPQATVTDEDLNKVVSGSPAPETTWVVGARKTLQSAVTRGTGSYTTKATQWVVPPNAVASYDFGANTTGTPTPVSSMAAQRSQLQYYWTAGDNTTPEQFSVQLDVTRTNEEAVPTGYLSYLVNTPPNVSLPATYSPTQFGKYDQSGDVAVSSGTQLNLPSSAGIETAFQATGPNAIPGYNGGGYFAASQVITREEPSMNGLPVADGCAIFSTNALLESGPVAEVGPGGSVTWNALDAPAQFTLPSPGQSLTYGDEFVDYFIYRPTGKNSIWVSLGTLTWGWQATITNTNGNYSLSNVVNSNKAKASTSTTEPTWNSIYNPGNVQCASLPSQ